MKDRLSKLIHYYQMTATRFADAIQVQRSGISHILSGRNQPSFDFIVKVIDKFPDVSAEWLLTGKGKMIKTTVERPAEQGRLKEETTIHSEEAPGYAVKEATGGKTAIVTNVTFIEKIVVFYGDGTFKAYDPQSQE